MHFVTYARHYLIDQQKMLSFYCIKIKLTLDGMFIEYLHSIFLKFQCKGDATEPTMILLASKLFIPPYQVETAAATERRSTL